MKRRLELALCLTGLLALPAGLRAWTAGQPPVPEQDGVYWYAETSGLEEMVPAAVDFREGIWGGVTGVLPGRHSRLALRGTEIIVIRKPDWLSIAEYRLIKLKIKGENREFPLASSSPFNRYSGPGKAAVPCQPERLERDVYFFTLPGLPAGEYGILVPANGPAGAVSLCAFAVR